jgi:CRP-like cAMP-binding protein
VSDRAGKMWYLKKINLFDHLDDEIMEELGDITHVQDVPEGQPIYFPGDNADTIFMLKKGRVRLSRSSPEGNNITLTILEPGDVFGEMALTDAEERQTRAETMSNAFICSSPKEKFLEVLRQNPDLNLRVTQMIGDRRREVEARVQNLIFKDSRERVLYVLDDLFENHSVDNTGQEIEFTHEQIANLTGLTRPTTSKVLNELAEKGVIELGRGCVRLVDPQAFARLSP